MSRGMIRDFSTVTLPSGTTEKGMVVHITDPENFYVQLARDQDVLMDMMAQISEAYFGSTDMRSGPWKVGDPCAALYEADEQWYRGKITGTQYNKDRVEVTFVDFGNKEYIEKDKIRPLLPEFHTIPVQSYRCCLEGIASAENFWSPEFVAQFEDMALEKEFTIRVVSYDSSQDTYSTVLTDEKGQNINKQFGQMTGSHVTSASAGLGRRIVRTTDGLDMKVTVTQQATAPTRGIAQALGIVNTSTHQSSLPHASMKLGEKSGVRVVFVTSPSEFWCHLQRNSEAIKRLGEQMTAAYNSMSPGDGLLLNLRPGSSCAAFSDSETVWYRATVQNVSGPEATIFYLDYGNTEKLEVGNLKELKEEFRSLPAQALQCSLSGVISLAGKWSDDASNEFEELIIEDEYTATVLGKDSSNNFSNKDGTQHACKKARLQNCSFDEPGQSQDNRDAVKPALFFHLAHSQHTHSTHVKNPHSL